MSNWSRTRISLVVGAVAIGLGAGAYYWHHERNKDVIAWVGDFPITQAAFKKEMHYRGGAYLKELDKQALLDEMIQKKLMLNKAHEMGYPDREDVQREYEYLLMGKVRKHFVEAEREKISVTEADIRQHYEQNRDEYKLPQKDRLAILFFKKRGDDPERNTVRLKAVQQMAEGGKLPEDALKGFGAHAVSHSEHQVSRYKGGEIGWFTKGQDVFWEQPVLDAGFALNKPGDLSDIVETDKGFYLVRLMERQVSAHRPLEAVSGRIRHKLILSEQQAVKDRFNQSLKKDFRVSVDNSKLEQVITETQYANEQQQPITPPAGVLN